MKGEQRLTRTDQYSRVFKQGISKSDRYLVLKAMPNQLVSSRYGISVSKRVGNAVVRNKVKRLLREILRTTFLKSGWDIILIARNPAGSSNFHELEKSVKNLLSRADIVAK